MSPSPMVYEMDQVLARFERIDSLTGFLYAQEPPIERLSDPYYGPWEELSRRLPDLLMSGQVRKFIDQVCPHALHPH